MHRIGIIFYDSCPEKFLFSSFDEQGKRKKIGKIEGELNTLEYFFYPFSFQNFFVQFHDFVMLDLKNFSVDYSAALLTNEQKKDRNTGWYIMLHKFLQILIHPENVN